MRKLVTLGLAFAGLLAFGEDIPWVYENNHPVDQVIEDSSAVTLAEAASSGLESAALDFFCSYWRGAFEVGPYTVLTPHRGVTVIIR